jgi:hypothetical protein
VSASRRLIEAWGVLGVVAMLGSGVARLIPHAAEALASPLGAVGWAGAAGIVAFMVYVEGYRGFHLRFSPRVVARARWIAADPRPLRVLLAPVLCMGLLVATRRRLVASWALTAMILFFIVAVRALPHPWRGLVDLGVVFGLSIGCLSMLHWWRVATRGGDLPVGPDAPD